jgi:4-diphosphocytidyl-2-C-methyl-D-erythritol kinase
MRARRSGSGWEIYAPAKLNLYLEVLGRREDGFHELETLMTPVRIFDRLTWSPGAPGSPRGFSLEYGSSTPAEICAAAPADAGNLVWRAFKLIADAAGVEPSGRVTLDKRIPVQAGMGGASSDAAAALVLANAGWGLGLGRTRLAELAAQLGSDVPFFLAGCPAICRGRGERVDPVAGLPRLHLVVVKPAMGVSTAEAFGALNAPAASALAAQDSQARLAELVDNLRGGGIAKAARQMVNRLEDVAARLCPGIERVRAAVSQLGCVGHLMTGSGSAYFAIMRSARQARQAARQLSSQLCRSAHQDAANLGTGFLRPQAFATVFAAATYRAASPPL